MSNNGDNKNKRTQDILDPAAAAQKSKNSKGLKDFANLKNSQGVTIKEQLLGFLKNPTVLGVILIVIIIIGLLGFLFNMPGLMMGKLKEIAQGLWDGIQSHFLTTADSFINDDDVTKLAQYLEDMQYDLIGYGFIRAKEVGDYPTYLELDEEYYMNSDGIYVKNDSDGQEIPYDGFYYGSTGYLIDNSTGERFENTNYVKDKYGIMYWASDIEANSAPDGEAHTAGQIAEINDTGILLSTGATGDDSLLRTYLMSDYRISVLRNDDEGLLEEFGTKLNQIFGGASNAWSKGLIKLYKRETKDDGTIKVSNLWDGASTFWVDDVSIVDNATKLKIRHGVFNRPMEFSLDGWTGRYGLSLEFLLSLHLGTMAPDLVTAMIQSFDTEVQVYVEEIPDAEVETKYVDYTIDSYEDEVEGNNEEITIAEINTVLEEDYWLTVQDGALIEWVNGLSLSKKKCLDILRKTGLSSPTDCIYTAVAYVIKYMHMHNPEEYGLSAWPGYAAGISLEDNYLNYFYGVNDSLLDEFDYQVEPLTNEFYTAHNSLYSLRNIYGYGWGDREKVEGIEDGLAIVENDRQDAINAAKEYKMPDDILIEPEIDMNYTGTSLRENAKIVEKNGEKYIEKDGFVYRIQREILQNEWSLFGYLNDTEEFVIGTEDDFNSDRDNLPWEETTAYLNSYIYEIYQAGFIQDNQVILYNEENESRIESDKGVLVQKIPVSFIRLEYDEVVEQIDDVISIYYDDDVSTERMRKFRFFNQNGDELQLLVDSTGYYIEGDNIVSCSFIQYFSDSELSFAEGVIYIEYDSDSDTYTISMLNGYFDFSRTMICDPMYTEGVSISQQFIDDGGMAEAIQDEFLYDVLYLNFVVRDKTLEELILSGILEIDEYGNYIINGDAGKCSIPTTVESDDITKCCSVCQRYVKKVVRALAAIQDTNYEYYQPYIARVVGSWFRDTYFIIPDEEDKALQDYYGEGNAPIGSWGIGGKYIKVDEEYLSSSGEYWTDYEKKTERLEDEEGNPILGENGEEQFIEIDEYQLYYLNPNGSTSNYKMEDWLAEAEEAVNDNGERYLTQEAAEKDGHVFVKRAKLLTLADIKENINQDNGGGRTTPYLDGTLWSAYTIGTGTDTGWIRVNWGENPIVDDVLNMVDGEGEFYYRLSSTKSIEQEEDAIRTETNITVKNLFRYRQFYIYDGSVARAEEIQKDREKVNKLIISYFENSFDYNKTMAINELAENGRYALRQAYVAHETIPDLVNDDNLAESWLEWQLDMYYRANNENSLSDEESALFKLDELCEYGVEAEFINEKGENEKFLDVNYYTSANHSLDPRNRHLISTVNITKSSLDVFSILENVNTLDADYQYRDFKELIVELNYFDKEDLSDTIEEVFTWLVPTYSTTWPILSIDKQNIDYGTLVHSQESIDFLIQVYERLLEEEKEFYGIEDSEIEEPDSETSEETASNKPKSKTEQTLKLLQEATSYAENGAVVSPVTGKILSYGTYTRTNVYTKELEDVGYVKIEIMGYGEMSDKSKSYFTKDMLSGIELTDEEKEKAVKGLNAFYDEYKKQCAGYILIIDGIDISELKNGFESVTDAEGNSVEYDELCKYEANEKIALYNSKEQKRREEEEEAKKEAPFFINYNGNYVESEGEYFSAPYDVSGYYVKEGAYLGKAQSATERTGKKDYEYIIDNENSSQGTTSETDIDSIIDVNKLYEEYLGDTNPDYLRLILLNDEMTVIDNVEDYFPGFEEEGNGGVAFSGSFSEEGLYWMIVGFEGLEPNEVRNGFVATDIGDGTVTAGGSGITNWCNNYFWELGYEEYVHYQRGSNIGMRVGDVIPGNVIMDIKAVVIDAHVNNVNNTFINNNFSQNQVEALASVSYNFGYIPESLKNAINTNSNIKEVWEHLSDSQAEEFPGLVDRRAAEYKLFTEGVYSNDSGIMNFTTNTPYTDYINGDNTVTYN